LFLEHHIFPLGYYPILCEWCFVEPQYPWLSICRLCWVFIRGRRRPHVTQTRAHMENYHIFFNTRYFIIAWFLVTKECVQHLNTKLFGYVIFCLSWVNFRSVYFSLGANVCTLLPPPSYHHLGVCVELNIYMIGSARMRCCCCCCCC